MHEPALTQPAHACSPSESDPCGCGVGEACSSSTCTGGAESISESIKTVLAAADRLLVTLDRAHLMTCSDPTDPARHTTAGDAAQVIRDLVTAVTRAAPSVSCTCCGRTQPRPNAPVEGGGFMHFDCWAEHHSDPTGNCPPGHTCAP